MAQYRTGKAFVTNGSTTVFGDISTDWSSILLASWFALQGSEVTYTVAANAVQRNAAYFAAYAGGTTYAQNDRISYGGNMYASLQASNLAHQPDISPLWWVQISGWEITLTGSWASATSSNRTYGIVKDFSTIYGLPLPAAGDVETAAIITRAFQILELAVANAGFIADTRRGMSVDIDTATGDAYGMEQVSAAQTGDAKALRIYTSALNSSYLAFGKYTSDTAFTEWGRFNNSGILDLNALSFKLGTTFEVTLSQAVTANRAIVFPNADGTLALVASSVPSVQGTANQILINGGTAVVTGTAAVFTLSATLASITSVSAAAATNLTLNSGSSGGSLALVQGTNGGATLTDNGTGQFAVINNGAAVNVMTLRNNSTSGFSTLAFLDTAGTAKGFIGFGNSASSAPYTNDIYIGSVTGADIINVINGVEVLTVSGGTIGTGAVTVRYTTTSTANNNGALVVAGGLGVAGTSWHGETVNVFKTSSSAFYTARQSGGAYASATAAYTMVSDNTTLGTNLAYAASRNGDTQYRFQINPDGLHAWGPGNAALDTNLYRNAANVLRTDDAFMISDATASTTTTSGALVVTGGVGIAGAMFVGGNVTLGTGAANVVSLGGSVSNFLQWPSVGAAAPTFTTRSAGTKIVLYPNIAADAVDYGIGVESGSVWYSTSQANSTRFHRWYGGTTSLMTLRGDGILTLPLNVASTSTVTGSLVVAGGVGIVGAVYIGNVLSVASNARFGGASNLASSTGITPVVQVASATSQGSLMLVNGLADATALAIYSAKMRGGVGVYTTATASEDALMFIAGEGADGVAALRRGASLAIMADALWTASSSPARIAFNTTPSGSTVSVERIRITNAGKVLVGVSSDSSNGIMQLLTHTTFAGGLGFGTETSLYRNAAGQLTVGRSSGVSRMSFKDEAQPTYTSYIQGAYSDNCLEIGVGSNALIRSVGFASPTRVDFPQTTASSSTVTGALTVAGGVGIGGVLYVKDIVIAQDDATDTLTFTRAAHDSYSIKLAGSTGLYISNVTDVRDEVVFLGTGAVSIPTNIAASSTVTGTLVLGGGVGIAGDTWIGGSINLPTDGAAINFANTGTNGKLTTSGGVMTMSNLASTAGTSAMVFTLAAGRNYLFSGGGVIFTPTARTTAFTSYFTVNTPADTGLTASTEAIGVNLVTATRTWATTGTVALQRERFFAGPTYASASASQTFTEVFNLYLTPPVQGSNAIFTRAHTLGIVDSTSAASSITGGLIVATTLGTAATSVGIGGGNINAGGTITAGGNIVHANGSAASPTSVFVGATTTGLYWANPGIGFSVAGVSVGIWSATALSVTGNLLPTTTLTPDIGSSSFVWRSLYVRDIVATGGTQFGLSVQTGTYTMLATDTVVVCNSGSTFTVTMLAAASHTRRVYVLKNKGTATVTVDATGLGQIDGANTQPILAGNSLMLVSDGTTWNIV